MEFKPTRIKTIISLVMGFLFGLFFYWYFRFKTMIPGPAPIEEAILALMISWLITFIMIYFLASIFQKRIT